MTDSTHLRPRMGLEMLVRDVMTKDVISITKYESIMHVANILTEKNISGLPVVDKDRKSNRHYYSGGYPVHGRRRQGAHVQRPAEVHARREDCLNGGWGIWWETS